MLRAFREIEPHAEVLYLGPRRWMLGRVHVEPTQKRAKLQRMGDNRVKIAREFAGKKIGAITAQANGAEKDAALRHWHQRQWFAKAMQQGFEGLHEWHADEITHEHVERFRAASYINENVRNAAMDQFDADAERQRAADEADLTDKHRAHDAHRYAFTRSHAVSASYGMNTKSSVIRDITPPKPAA